MVFCFRSARYSGSERPAWRMNHTGTRLGLRPAAAARYGDSGSVRRSLIRFNAATPQRTRDRWSTRAPDAPSNGDDDDGRLEGETVRRTPDHRLPVRRFPATAYRDLDLAEPETPPRAIKRKRVPAERGQRELRQRRRQPRNQQLCRAETAGWNASLQPPRHTSERPQINAKEQTCPRSREQALNNTICLGVTLGAGGSAATCA
jgi:hypothetical protein